MKKVIVGAAVVMLPISLLLVVGYFRINNCNANSLPPLKQMTMKEWPTAPLRAAVRVRLEASPDEVFKYISSAKTLPEWMPGLESLSYDHANSTATGALGEGSRRQMMFGDQAEIEEIVQIDIPNLVAYQILEGVPLRNHLAVMTVEESGDGGSTFTWYQYFDIKKSSVSGWMTPFLVRRFLNDAQENLIRQFGGVSVEVWESLCAR